MTAPYTGYEARWGHDSPLAHQEFSDFMDRHKQILEMILGQGQMTHDLERTAAQQSQQQPAPVMNFPSLWDRMFGGDEQTATAQRPEAIDQLVAQARFWDIPNPEQMRPADLYRLIQERRALVPRDEQTDAGSMALATLGAASEAGGATSRLIGNLFGDVKKLPFVGDALSKILHTEQGKYFMYDLSQKTAEFTEAARAAQPLQDRGAFEMMTASGKVAGSALPAMLMWNAVGALGGYVPAAWAGRVASPLGRAAIQGGLTGVALEAGSDESASSKIFNIGLGMLFGASTAIPKLGASLGFGAIGYGIGAQVGDTPEERRRHGIEGALAGAFLPLAPVIAGAAAKIKRDIRSPFDAAVEEQVRIAPSGLTPEAARLQTGPPVVRATYAGGPEPTGPDFTVEEPRYLVRSEPPIDTPEQLGHAMTQAPPPEQPRLPAPARGGKLDGTRVVGADGNPMVVYHGTEVDFQAFSPEALANSRLEDGGLFGPGFYHTDNPEVASSYAFRGIADLEFDPLEGQSIQGYGPQIRPAKLNIQNPLDMNATMDFPAVSRLADQLDAVAPDYDWHSVVDTMEPWIRQLGPRRTQDIYESLSRTFAKVLTPEASAQAETFGQRTDIVGKTGLNAALEKTGYDGIVGKESPLWKMGQPDIADPNAYNVWVAFRPDQVHSPWDVAPMSTADAATSADVLSKQASIFESQTLPDAVGKVQITDADVVDALYGANPGGISLIRGLSKPVDLLDIPNLNRVYFVDQGGGKFDALVGDNIDYNTFDQYRKYGVFTGQKVVTASGHEGEISKIGDLITIKRPSGPPLRVRPENVLPSRFGSSSLQAPDLWNQFKGDLLVYANAEAFKAGMAPVTDITDPRVSSIMADHVTRFLDKVGLPDPAMRQVVDTDFNNRYVAEMKDLDPEMRDFQAALVNEAVTAGNETEASDLHSIVTSMEEKAEKRGFIWITRPGEGGVLKDTVNPGTPDFPMATDEAANEFLARADRALPDFTPVSDTPIDVADMLPTDLGHEPRLSTEDLGDSLAGSVRSMRGEGVYDVTTGELTPEYITYLNSPEGQNELAERLLSTEQGRQSLRQQVFDPTGSGGFLPPTPPVPPSGGGGAAPELPPGQRITLGDQFDRMRRADPAKLHQLVYDFQGLLSSKIRYMRYGMLNLERRLTDAGIDLGRAWQHYEDLDTARTLAFNEGQPWLSEWGEIMRSFPRRVIRDGTVTRIHEIEDPNARYAAWYRTEQSHGLNDRQIRKALDADNRITDYMHRFFTHVSGDPAFSLGAEREIFRYMPHVRARQAQGVPNPYEGGGLSPETQFFAEYARDGNLQFRVMDARELGNHLVRAAMFKKYEAAPWRQLVEAWQDPRVPQSMQDFMLDWARLVRFGYDPSGELAVRGVQSIAKHVLGAPVTMREAQHLLNIPSSAMYMSMLGGRMSIFFRDAIQPMLALAKVRLPYMRDVYSDVMVGAGQSMTRQQENTLKDMYNRGLAGGWIEKENPNLEAAGFFEEQPGVRENELLHLSPEQAARRELFARTTDITYQLPAWLARPSQSNLSTLKWYGRQGQLHRLIVGDAAFRQATDALAAYRRSSIDTVLARDPSLEIPYEKLENDSFFGSFEPPIRRRLREMVDQGDDQGAAELFAREVANWSQFRYGRREVPPALRGNIGRNLSMFGNFTGQFLEGLASSMANGTSYHKARYGMVVGSVSAALYLAKHLTGWSFDKWTWIPYGVQYVGGPMLEMGARGVAAVGGLAARASGRPVSEFEQAAIKEEVTGGVLPSLANFLPYTGYIRTGAEYAGALEGINPAEQIARYTITGDRGSRIDTNRMLEELARKHGQMAPGSLSPNGGSRSDAFGPGNFSYPKQGYHYPSPPDPQHPERLGPAGGTTP